MAGEGTVLALRMGYGLVQGVGVPIPPEVMSAFNPDAIGLKITPNGAGYAATYDKSKVIPASLAAATQYYVDNVNGNDGSTGLSWAQALKTASRAFNVGNLAGVPYRVKVKAGTPYNRAQQFSGAGGTTVPTQPVYIEADGGRVVMGNWDDLTWAVDGTYPNTYSAARSGVGRVVDLAGLTEFGDYPDLTRVATAADCNTTPNSWTIIANTTVYVNRGGQPVTNANTRAYLNGAVEVFNPGTVDCFVKGIDFEGGRTNGSVNASSTATRNLVFEDCSAKYAGVSGGGGNGFYVADTTGYAIFERCLGACSVADAFNFHWLLGGTPGLKALTIDCEGRDEGRFTNTSNNGWTLHDGIVGIDVNGLYRKNRGANVHIIDACLGYCVGSRSDDSLGDQGMGGGIPSVSYMTGNSARLWLLGVKGSGSTYALMAQGTSTILKRQIAVAGIEQVYSSGVITTW